MLVPLHARRSPRSSTRRAASTAERHGPLPGSTSEHPLPARRADRGGHQGRRGGIAAAAVNQGSGGPSRLPGEAEMNRRSVRTLAALLAIAWTGSAARADDEAVRKELQ